MTSEILRRRAALLLAGAAAIAFPMGSAAWAQASNWVASERGAVRLVSAVKAVGAGNTLDIGVEIKLEPGWKTYWRVPGESGMPPRFDWSASVNLAEATVVWPGPMRFTIAGMQSYGYKDHVVLPVRVALAEAGKATAIRLHLRYAICREVCVPEEARLAIDLKPGAAAATAHAGAIAAFAARAPRAGEIFGWTVARAAIVSTGESGHRKIKLVVDVAGANEAFRAPELVAEGGEALQFGLSSARLEDDGRRVRFAIPLRRGTATAGDTVDLTLTLLDGPRRGTFSVRAEVRR